MVGYSGLLYRGRSALAKLGISLIAASRLYDGYWNYWRSNHLFDFAETKGLHILPVHYYTPVPTKHEIGRTRRQNTAPGITLNIDAGTKLATALLADYADGISELVKGSNGFDAGNSGFGPLDASILYGMIRKTKPSRIIEIGSGMSTVVMLSAIKDNSLETSLTCIEPFLPEYLNHRRQELKCIIESDLQEVPLSAFDQLESGDLLFIDSTHVVKFNSDVVYELLDILPRLRPGVLIHIHDIFLPDDYPREWLDRYRYFWAEQYLLQAFLCMNQNFRVEIPLSAIKEHLFEFFPAIPKTSVETGSFWIRRI
jgi:predicted O-methyltransferase YrrM